MCFGLQNKSHCILNTQYSAEEYFKIVDDIKSDMLKNGEYGDGIDMNFSALSYNFSIAQISFPLDNETIIKLGGYIAKEPDTNAGNVKIINFENIPQTIDEVPSDIIDFALECKKTGKLFRVTDSEFYFYKEMKLPLPMVHPVVRMQEHLILNPIGKKYISVCVKCNKPINSLFNPEENYMLYCEDCYKKEVY